MFLKNKKAISGIIMTVILIALVLSMSIVIYNIVENSEKELEKAQSCNEIRGEIEINKNYLCYDSSDKSIIFGINIGDVKIDRILVAIQGEETSEPFEIPSKENQTLKMFYNNSLVEPILPNAKSGKTYIIKNITFEPKSIEIVPKINEKSCQGEKINSIMPCSQNTNIQNLF